MLAAALLASRPAGAARLAVLEFKGEDLAPKALSYLSRKVRGEALKHLPAGWEVMTRDNMLVLIDAAAGQCVKEGECEVETGRHIGADLVVSGEVVKLGSKLRLTMNAYDTASGRLLRTAEAASADVDGLIERLPGACRTLFGGSRTARPARRPSDQRFGEQPAGTWELPVRPEHTVRFETIPPGASVYVDDVYLCETPCSRAVGEGRRRLLMKRPRYEPADEPLEVQQDETVERELRPVFGWLTARSEPSGLAVHVDGKAVGTTPLVRHEVDPGRHEVLVTDPRYYDSGMRVEVARAEEKTVEVTLTPRQGGLRVRLVDGRGNDHSLPVTLDGGVVGNTPWVGKVLIGRHVVSAGGVAQEVVVEEREVETVALTISAAMHSPGNRERSAASRPARAEAAPTVAHPNACYFELGGAGLLAVGYDRVLSPSLTVGAGLYPAPWIVLGVSPSVRWYPWPGGHHRLLLEAGVLVLFDGLEEADDLRLVNAFVGYEYRHRFLFRLKAGGLAMPWQEPEYPVLPMAGLTFGYAF